MRTSGHSRKLAVDANVILSAVAGKAALRVFLDDNIEFVTTHFNIEEVREYLGVIAAKYGFSEEILESQLRLLPLKVYPGSFYEDFLQKAAKRLVGRDSDDIELLALALRLRVFVWSNDRDFRTSGTKVFTTARLLKLLKA